MPAPPTRSTSPNITNQSTPHYAGALHFYAGALHFEERRASQVRNHLEREVVGLTISFEHACPWSMAAHSTFAAAQGASATAPERRQTDLTSEDLDGS